MPRTLTLSLLGISLLLLPLAERACLFGQEMLPRRQKEMPGPPTDPMTALQKMEVPPGFHVELVAAEPDLINPVAMAFDDRGRIFVCESFEYPRKEAGPGRDRIKILEDTNGDGRVDRVQIFAEGLNIPSGIAVGHGGVWVANAPDLLFLEDLDGDDRADRQTVIATGFGRDDTHELPNALTWGPDGWLYGLNGVFNPSHVTQPHLDAAKGAAAIDFTCAMFRIDPKSKRFELFCEGTSNPWGIAFDNEGSPFISACVIDHLWHLTESGYYHRQGGPYPPHTWKIESIVDYTHQMAAYCGIEFLDSPAFPAEYRQRLYMGNIHGGCINVDRVERQGATYRGHKEPDFLTAHDVWFMPVAQKVGPDGCLYILDWYDRYHCYQDANADPAGIDRGHGRLYRVVHDQRPSIPFADLTQLDSKELLKALHHPNIFWRQRAQLEIAKRNDRLILQDLQTLALNPSAKLDDRRRAIWSLIATSADDESFWLSVLSDNEPSLVAWGVRAVAYRTPASPAIVEAVGKLCEASDPRVRIEVAIASRKLLGKEAFGWLSRLAQVERSDLLIAKILWQNWLPTVLEDQAKIVQSLQQRPASDDTPMALMGPRFAERWLSELTTDANRPDANHADASKQKNNVQTLQAVSQLTLALAKHAPIAASQVAQSLLQRLQDGQLAMVDREEWLSPLAGSSQFDVGHGSWLRLQFALFDGDRAALQKLERGIVEPKLPPSLRLSLARTLIACEPSRWPKLLALLYPQEGKEPLPDPLRDWLILSVASQNQPENHVQLLNCLPRFDESVQAMTASRFCQRADTAELLLQQIADGKLHRELIGPNQLQQLANSKPAIQSLIAKIWGSVRGEKEADRQKVVNQQSDYLLWDATGDASKGWVIYDRVCGQCHLLHGRGHEVGPDITRNGRGSFEQLISNIFDPSLVVGEAYRSVLVTTDDGRVLQGLIVERTEEKLVLRVQGGKTETLASSEIVNFKESPKSLMPEGLETQINPQELADLFALLSLENPTELSKSRRIRGTPAQLHSSK